MMNSLADWLLHLESLHPKGQAGIELGLDRVRRVAARLAQPAKCPVITVGGTNGKGSTCAYLESMYRAGGYRTALYTSPHLLAYNERVRVNGAAVGDAALIAAFARVEAARQAAAPGGEALTYFEFGTLAAWAVFAAARPELIILEVGLGGRLDAVNLYDPDVAIVTSVALDHQDYLGTTRDAIGDEKAGIFRAGRPALCADPAPPATLLAHATAIGADLRLIGRDFGVHTVAGERAQWTYWSQRGGATVRRTLAYPGLRGRAQLRNAAVAIAATEVLAESLPLALSAVRQGLVGAELTGRFQALPGRPVVVLDVAHNPQATEELAENLSGMGYFDQTLAVVGMLADKDLHGALQPLLGRVDHWFVAPLPSPRDAGPERLAAVLTELGNTAPVQVCVSVAEACARAAERANETDRILAFGSFLTVADTLRWRSVRTAGAQDA